MEGVSLVTTLHAPLAHAAQPVTALCVCLACVQRLACDNQTSPMPSDNVYCHMEARGSFNTAHSPPACCALSELSRHVPSRSSTGSAGGRWRGLL